MRARGLEVNWWIVLLPIQPSSPARFFACRSPWQDTFLLPSTCPRHAIRARQPLASRRNASRSVWLKPSGSKR
jgi:hypothetical protein